MEIAVRLKKLRQLKSKEKREKHLLFAGSDTVITGCRTAQGGLFSQNNETEVSFRLVLVFFLMVHLNLSPRHQAPAEMPPLQLRL